MWKKAEPPEPLENGRKPTFPVCVKNYSSVVAMITKSKKLNDIKKQKAIIKETLCTLWQIVRSGQKPDQDFRAGLNCLNESFINHEKLFSKRQYKSYMDLIFYIAECERFSAPAKIRQNKGVTYNQWLYSRMYCL